MRLHAQSEGTVPNRRCFGGDELFGTKAAERLRAIFEEHRAHPQALMNALQQLLNETDQLVKRADQLISFLDPMTATLFLYAPA